MQEQDESVPTTMQFWTADEIALVKKLVRDGVFYMDAMSHFPTRGRSSVQAKFRAIKKLLMPTARRKMHNALVDDAPAVGLDEAERKHKQNIEEDKCFQAVMRDAIALGFEKMPVPMVAPAADFRPAYYPREIAYRSPEGSSASMCAELGNGAGSYRTGLGAARSKQHLDGFGF